MHTHFAEKSQTLREARYSIPRATWKLKEMRSSRNNGALDADLGSGGKRADTGVEIKKSCLNLSRNYIGYSLRGACLTEAILFVCPVIKLCPDAALSVTITPGKKQLSVFSSGQLTWREMIPVKFYEYINVTAEMCRAVVLVNLLTGVRGKFIQCVSLRPLFFCYV